MGNSKIYLGNTNIGSLFKGASDISIYLGENKVYPLGEPVFKWKATYSDSHTESAQCGSSSEIVNGEINPDNLVSVEIGDCAASIGNSVFSFCESLTSCTIGSGVTSIGSSAFFDCRGLTSITIPDSVTSIGDNAFSDCRSLTSCTIGSGVTSIGDSAFNMCTSLTSIDIPSGVTSICDYAFQSCNSLTSITVNATTPPTLGEYAIDDTNNCPIYVPSASLTAYQTAWPDYASRIQAIQNS